MKIKLVPIFLAVFIVGCAAEIAVGQSELLRRTTTKSDRFDFSAGGTVSVVGSPSGSIKIRASQRNEIELTAEIEVKAANEADLQALAAATGFFTQETLGRVGIISIGVDSRQNAKKADKKLLKRLAGLPYRIDYVISVPRYCDLEINSGKGMISVEGVEGNIRINAIEADTKLDLIGGGVSATIGKGDVLMTMPDRSWRGGTIEIQVANGSLGVALPANLSCDLDATILRSGKIENELTNLKPRNRNAAFTDRSIAAKAGNGGVSMKFTVGDGTLRLSRIGKVE